MLAASSYQLDTIRTAKRLGYKVITTDNVPSNPGHSLADKSYYTDTTDIEGVLDIARLEHIAGVIAPCTDVAVPTAAYVAEKMGLVGPPYSSARILCDKPAFREFLISHKLPCPESFRVNRNSTVPVDISSSRQWILKPDKSSGSKGVFILSSPTDFFVRIDEAVSFSPTGTAVLEEYILGHQGTCEGILRDGELALTLVTDRHTVAPPFVVTSGHSVPSTLSGQQTSALASYLSRVWGILGVTDGPFDCDFVATPDEVYLIEMTPRLGGNSLNTLWRKCLNFDIVKYSIKTACGDVYPLLPQQEPRPTGLVLFGTDHSGLLSYDEGELERLRKESWVDYILFDSPSGASVDAFINGRHRVGEALIFAADRPELDSRIEEVKRRLSITAV